MVFNNHSEKPCPGFEQKKETKFTETLNFLNEFIDLMGLLRFDAKGEWKPF